MVEASHARDDERPGVSDEDDDETYGIRGRNKLVMAQAREAGYLDPPKDTAVSGRLSARLIEAARRHARVSSDTELLELALSRMVLEDDDWGRTFVKQFRGSVPKDVDLEF